MKNILSEILTKKIQDKEIKNEQNTNKESQKTNKVGKEEEEEIKKQDEDNIYFDNESPNILKQKEINTQFELMSLINKFDIKDDFLVMEGEDFMMPDDDILKKENVEEIGILEEDIGFFIYSPPKQSLAIQELQEITMNFLIGDFFVEKPIRKKYIQKQNLFSKQNYMIKKLSSLPPLDLAYTLACHIDLTTHKFTNIIDYIETYKYIITIYEKSQKTNDKKLNNIFFVIVLLLQL